MRLALVGRASCCRWHCLSSCHCGSRWAGTDLRRVRSILGPVLLAGEELVLTGHPALQARRPGPGSRAPRRVCRHAGSPLRASSDPLVKQGLERGLPVGLVCRATSEADGAVTGSCEVSTASSARVRAPVGAKRVRQRQGVRLLVPPPTVPAPPAFFSWLVSFSPHVLKFSTYGLLQSTLNLLAEGEPPQARSRRPRKAGAAPGALQVPRSPPSLVRLSPTDGERPEAELRLEASSPLPTAPPGFCGPPAAQRGPAHLHEVPVVFQHTAGRLPGVLIALPGVHPDTVRKKSPLVSGLTLFP